MLPFVVGGFLVVVRLAIGPVSDAFASAAPPPPIVVVSDAGTRQDAGQQDAGHGKSPSPPPMIDAPTKGTIVVPASVVAKAIERRDVSASNATGPDGKPLGARIQGASKYRAGIRDGDIITYVAGTRTETTQAMVAAATRSLASGATSLRGKILRLNDRGADETWDVVLELPRQD